MQRTNMSKARVIMGICLTLMSFSAFPAAAQTLTYTLTGVTFNDGAVVGGYFNFDPTMQTFGAYDITTTNGMTDLLTGAHYASGPDYAYHFDSYFFSFGTNTSAHHDLYLGVQSGTNAATPGVYVLAQGAGLNATTFSESGEFVTADGGYRLINAGTLVVTPEPSQSAVLSLGAFSLVVLGVNARRRNAVSWCGKQARPS